jgi:hypothetical protein
LVAERGMNLIRGIASEQNCFANAGGGELVEKVCKKRSARDLGKNLRPIDDDGA